MFYFFRSEPGAAELRGLARQESGRVCQRVLMIANLLEGMGELSAASVNGLPQASANAVSFTEEVIAMLRKQRNAA